jgi:hypothetical protein
MSVYHNIRVIRKVMPSWARVAPLIWCFIPSWLLSNEILLNRGMKYSDSGLSARAARTFIASVHIAGAVISWRRSEKERTGQTQFSTQFAAKLSFIPLEPRVPPFISCFLKSHPLCDQTGVPVRLFLTLRITLMFNDMITFVFKWSHLMCLRFS